MKRKRKKDKNLLPWVAGGAILLYFLTRGSASAQTSGGGGVSTIPETPAGGGGGGTVAEPAGVATIVNKNPGALIRTNENWVGEIASPPGYEFWEAFKDWPHGWRAFIKNSDFHIRGGQNTLSKLINRHAMGFSGKTAPNYISFVSQETGYGVNEPLPTFASVSKQAYISKMWPVLRAMAIFEGGAKTRDFYNTQKPNFEQGVNLV